MAPVDLSLPSRDLRAALSFAGELAECESEQQLGAQTRRLPDLVGADAMIVGRVERAARGRPAISAEDDPAGWFDAATGATFARCWRQQPLVPVRFGQVEPGAAKISDFLSRRQWRRREIYVESYRRAGLDWELAAQVHASRRHVRCVALQRSRSDFDERDRALLELITPHLCAAHRRLAERAVAASRLALLEGGLEGYGGGVVLIDRGGALEIGPRAQRLLEEWFGVGGQAAGLPAPVADWLGGGRPGVGPATFDVARGDRRLRLRLVAGQSESVLLLSETRSSPPAPEAIARRLPLSRREAEVLARLAVGGSNSVIGSDLGISPHTVARHLERIYTKLGVQNRAAATAAAFEALR